MTDLFSSHKKNTTKISEQDIIEIMQYQFQNTQHTSKHKGDDLGYATLNATSSIAINTDTLVQSTDMPPCMTLKQAAQKSVISCISDFAAKGIKPKFVAISVNMPKDVSKKDVLNIAKGFAASTKEYDIKIIAGDTNAGTEFVFNVCMIGNSSVASTANKIKRSGAKIGNKIFVTGPFGYTKLGLEILLKSNIQKKNVNKTKNKKNQDTKDPTIKNAIKSVLQPKVNLNFTIQCAVYFTSSMDSSDGLAATLNEMSLQSKCEFEIQTIPATRQFIEYAQQNNKNLKDLVFNGGEEYETVFTAHPNDTDSIMKLARKFKVHVIEIGTVTKKDSKGKVYIKKEKKKESATKYRAVIKNSGWSHF